MKEHIAGNLADPTDDRRHACADQWAVWAADTELDWPTGEFPASHPAIVGGEAALRLLPL